MTRAPIRSLTAFLGTLLIIGLVTAVSPLEKTLGANARLVYFHGAWVWGGLITFMSSALTGLVALLTRRSVWHTWSRVLGWTGMTFWLTYLPVSLIVMQINWGGLFLDEPRWRIALAFAIIGILLQAGLELLNTPYLTSASNLLFAGALFYALTHIPNILHPASPILNSNSHGIQAFFVILVLLSLAAGVQIAFAWLRFIISKRALDPLKPI